jgi:hypothetical protein
MSEIVNLTICFNDGSEKKYTFPRAEDDAFNRGTILDKIVSGQSFVFEIDGDMMIIPASSIKYIKVSPKPVKMPTLVIPNLSEVK